MKTVVKFTLLSVLLALLSACGGSDESSNPTDSDGNTNNPAAGTLVVDETQTISETQSRSYSFNAGTYLAVITSPDHGVRVEWTGSGDTCPTYSETKNYTNTCTLTAGAQLKITNPNDNGTYGDEHVTIKVTVQ